MVFVLVESSLGDQFPARADDLRVAATAAGEIIGTCGLFIVDEFALARIAGLRIGDVLATWRIVALGQRTGCAMGDTPRLALAILRDRMNQSESNGQGEQKCICQPDPRIGDQAMKHSTQLCMR